eukprot:scpid70307/ scgid14690/ 
MELGYFGFEFGPARLALHRPYLEEAAEYVLKTEGVNEPEHTAVLDISVATGERTYDDDTDYCISEISLFLRKLVCNGNVASVEEVLQILKECDESRVDSKNFFGESSPETSSWSSSETSPEPAAKRPFPNSPPSPKPQLRIPQYQNVRVSAKVGKGPLQRDSETRCSEESNSTDTACPATSPHTKQLLQSQQRAPGPIYEPPDFEELLGELHGGEGCFRSTLLHCAILTGNEEMVRCLLKWGAFATSAQLGITGKKAEAGLRGAWVYFPIGVAAILQHSGIVRCLIEHGVSPYKGAHLMHREVDEDLINDDSDGGDLNYIGTVTAFSLARGHAPTCLALCQNPQYPPPMIELCITLALGDEDSARCMMPYCRWETDCCQWNFAYYLYTTPSCRVLLNMPCFTDDERICKQFCCSLVLKSLCSGSAFLHYLRHHTLKGPIDAEELADVVRHVLHAGAHPAGLSISEGAALCTAWLKIEKARAARLRLRSVRFRKPVTRTSWPPRFINHGRFPVDSVAAPCLTEETREKVYDRMPPVECLDAAAAQACFGYGVAPVVDRLLAVKTTEDAVVQLLIKHDGLPHVTKRADELPLVDGYLHDGPSCQCAVELSPAQRKVSVLDLVRSYEPQTRRLTSLCRSTVANACREYGVSKAIHCLNLPPLLVNYLMYK